MQKMNFKLLFLLAVLSFSFSMKAQLVPPVNVRNEYVVQKYSFSPQQVRAYNQILSKVDVQQKALRNQKTSVQNRSNGEIRISSDLCAAVGKALSAKQYDRWYDNHKGHLVVRFYKEDLGMTDSQLVQLKKAVRVFSDKKKSVEKNNLSETEQATQREQAFQQYCTSLRSFLTSAVANYLIQENQVLNIAAKISGKYTLMSETKAIQYAVLKMQHDKDMEDLEAQTLNVNQKRKARSQLTERFDKSLKALFTNEEYIACGKRRDWLTDRREMHTYKMSPVQLSQYKEIRKILAIRQLKIKQSKQEKSIKATKLQEVESEFETDLKKVMGIQQFDVWKEDQTMRKKRKPKK